MNSVYHHGLLSQPACQHCPLQTYRKVLPDGLVPASIAIVGEGPGPQEEREGRGLVGPTGKLTWILAESVGLYREMCWISNAALCRPRKVRMANGIVLEKEKVKVLSVAACRQRLIEELCIVNPRVIVTMGNMALWAIKDMPNAKITDYRGSIMQVDLGEMLRNVISGNVRLTVPYERKSK